MLLKKMKIKNIRSYKDETIDFEDGVLIFQGDIGSGKSSILYSLEFVLFGGTQRNFYDKIMRHEAKKASVERLVLTHVSPRHTDISKLEEEAEEVFPNSVFAEDFLELEVELKN